MLRAFLALVLVACSKDDPKVDAPKDAGPGRVGSCDRVTAVSTCSEYRIGPDEAQVTAGCAKLGGTFVYSECPNTSIVGACKLSTGEVRKFYSGGGASYDVVRAQKDCTTTFKGSWTPQ